MFSPFTYLFSRRNSDGPLEQAPHTGRAQSDVTARDWMNDLSVILVWYLDSEIRTVPLSLSLSLLSRFSSRPEGV